MATRVRVRPPLRRVKKKSDSASLGAESASGASDAASLAQDPADAAPEAAAEAGGQEAAAPGGAAQASRTEADGPAGAEALEAEGDSDKEENIYEIMKGHMRRKQEELEARNAQLRQQAAAGGRPGPGGMGRPGFGRPGPNVPAPAVAPVVEKASDLADLAGVWRAARNYLSQHARMLESVLGHVTKVHRLQPEGGIGGAGEVLLHIANTQERFTNDRARAKLEEALRAVTGLPLKLLVEFVEPEAPPAGVVGVVGAAGGAPLATAQRIPPEVMEAVKSQPLVQELMKRFDATVTNVEMMGNEGASGS